MANLGAVAPHPDAASPFNLHRGDGVAVRGLIGSGKPTLLDVRTGVAVRYRLIPRSGGLQSVSINPHYLAIAANFIRKTALGVGGK